MKKSKLRNKEQRQKDQVDIVQVEQLHLHNLLREQTQATMQCPKQYHSLTLDILTGQEEGIDQQCYEKQETVC